MEFKTEDDFKLVLKLMRNPLYEVPEHLRKGLFRDLELILNDPYAKSGEKLAAIKVILQADRINIDLLKLVVPRKSEKAIDIDVRNKSTDELKELLREGMRLLNVNPSPKVIDCEVLGVGSERGPVATVERDRLLENDRKEVETD